MSPLDSTVWPDAEAASDAAFACSPVPDTAKYRSLFEHVTAGFCLFTPDGRIVFANSMVFTLLGYRVEEMVGLNAFDLTHPDETAEARAAFECLLSDPDRAKRVQFRARHKDGTWRWLEGIGRNALDDPAVRALVVSFWDIDRQKRDEAERARLERTLRVVTACHHSLRRAGDEEDLLEGICKVIVEVGGYRLAWVGMAERDAQQTIRPVAQAGFSEGYVEHVNVVWSDTPRGQGPAGWAIRSGRPCLTRNTATDPAFKLWREQAQRRGFASVFSIPLRDNAETLGALSIYASEPDAFSEEETRLLVQLAEDVTHRLASQRAQQARELAEEALEASEERLRRVVESNVMGVMFWRNDGLITDANAPFLQMIGYSREEVRAERLRWSDITPPEYAGQDARALAELAARSACRPFEKEYFRKDGSRVPVLITAALLHGFTDRGVSFVVDLSERKRIERELVEERNLLRTLIDHVPDYIYVKDTESRHLLNNRANLELMGAKSVEETIGRTAYDFFPPELAAKYVEDDRALFRSGEPLINVEEPITNQQGEPRWLLTTKVPLRDPEGTIKGLVGISRDITERKQTEETLARERNLFRSILDNLPLCVYVIDQEQRFVLNNRAHLRLLGLEAPDDAAGKCAAGLLPAEAVAVALEDARSVLETGAPVFQRECEFTDANGRRRTHAVSTVPLLDRQGRVASAIGISQDITERKHAEQQIQKLAAFPQVNPHAVFEFGADGNLNYCNEAARQMTALLKKVHPSEILPAGTIEIVRQCLASGNPKLRLETKVEGHTISWSFFPVSASQVVHCYASDITERVALELQLRHSQKMESVGLLAGGVAHDFNNILTVIQGHASLLIGEALAPDQTDSARQIAEAAERAANLTRQLLTFSRRQVLQPRNVDLNEIVANITKMLQRLVGEHITLDLRYASNLPLVYADPGMMEQILVNLAVNSRDAMPRGGRLGIALRAVPFEAITGPDKAAASPGNYVAITFSDTGCGIAASDLEHIFEPFFTTKDVGQGTGLGLATVYGIVKQHEGWITVQSQVGHGTTFEIFLPGSTRKGGPASAGNRSRRELHGRERILVVEDEAPLRELVRCILETYGYDVLEAPSGKAALELWPEHGAGIDLLLTDMVMPEGVTGRDLAELLKQKKPSLRVVFTSGYSADIVGRDFILEEGTNFLQKPYDPQTLAQTVRDCLDCTACPGGGVESS